MNAEEQMSACRNAKLFSRVEPAHKSKIVGYLQKDGHISAMVILRLCILYVHPSGGGCSLFRGKHNY